MKRFNGGDCYVKNKDGKNIGRFHCFVFLEESRGNDLVNPSIGNINNDEVKFKIKDVIEKIDAGYVTITNKFNGKYLALMDEKVSFQNLDGELLFSLSSNDALSKIKELSEEEYASIEKIYELKINWEKINTNIGGKVVTKDKAFEALCADLINCIKSVKITPVQPTGGGDGGRDYEWSWSTIDNEKLDFLDLPAEKWIAQCKYSIDPNTSIKYSEIWEGIIQAVQYYPIHYILFTNRKLTRQFNDWWNGLAMSQGRRDNLIPFTLHLVNRENLERLLDMYQDIKKKYFG